MQARRTRLGLALGAAALVGVSGCDGTYAYSRYGAPGYRASGHHSSSGYVSAFGYDPSPRRSSFSMGYVEGGAEDLLFFGVVAGIFSAIEAIRYYCWGD